MTHLDRERARRLTAAAGLHLGHLLLALAVVLIGAASYSFIKGQVQEAAIESVSVVRGMHFEGLQARDGYIEGEVFGRKVRNCLFLPSFTKSALVSIDGVQREVPLLFPYDSTPGSTRPSGEQSFGTWRIMADRIDLTEATFMTAHLCPGEEQPVVTIFTLDLTNGST